MLSLFESYPALKDKLPYTSLAELPTPVEKLNTLGNYAGIKDLYIKRDDLSSHTYGGNKVRKLEFILGNALQKGTKDIITFGCAGSNHALATAIYARQLGIRSTSILRPQPNAEYVRKNLLFSYDQHAQLIYYKGLNIISGTLSEIIRDSIKYRKLPLVIRPGGSSPLGTIGYVNAAFELKDQIDRGLVPTPDYIYVAAGTLGTSVGLMLGLKALNIPTKVISVRVVPREFCRKQPMIRLFRKTIALLRSADPSFPELSLKREEIFINHDFSGKEYALFTEEGVQAIQLMKETEDIQLDGTYTAKVLAALLNDLKDPVFQDKTILFWNTYNSVDFSSEIKDIDYKDLPEPFHIYFENEVQPLDKKRTGYMLPNPA